MDRVQNWVTDLPTPGLIAAPLPSPVASHLSLSSANSNHPPLRRKGHLAPDLLPDGNPQKQHHYHQHHSSQQSNKISHKQQPSTSTRQPQPDITTNIPLVTRPSFDIASRQQNTELTMYSHDSKAIRGNFIPVSKSMGNRSRSPTLETAGSQPQKHLLQLSLTESQMEKLAKVLSEDGDAERESRGRPAAQPQAHQPEAVTSSNPKIKEHKTLKQRLRSLSPAKRRKDQQEPTPSRQRSPSPARRGTGQKTSSSEQHRHGYDPESYQSPQPASKVRQFHQHQVSWDKQYESPKPVSRQRQQQDHHQQRQNCLSPQSASRQRQEHHQQQVAAEAASEVAAFRLGSPSPSRRRQDRIPLAPIDTDIARLHAKVTAQREPIVIHYSPEPDARVASQAVQLVTADKSSVYSQENQEQAVVSDPRFRSQISPLHIVKEISRENNQENDSAYSQTLSILQDYGNWSNWVANPESTQQNNQASEAPRAPTKLSNHSGDRPGTGQGSNGAATDDFHFSALTPLFPVHNINNPNRNMRMASKTLIGENGWLESTSRPSDGQNTKQPTTAATTTPNGHSKKPSTAAAPARKPGFLDNLVKKAKDFVSAPLPEANNQRSSHDSNKPHSPRTLQISLTPREQSLLYCEMEFLLSTLLNTYISTQLSLGLLDMGKVKRISESWQSKGRPRVVSFRYDLETQLDLVRLHVNDFKFYGPAAANTTAVLGIVDGVKTDARAMRIRTFCQPDTVVAKQLVGARALCGLLGAGDTEERKLGECIGFFRAVVEREVQKGMIESGQNGEEQKTIEQQQEQEQRESGNTTTSNGDGIWVGGAPQYQGPPSPILEQIPTRSQSPVRRAGGHSSGESNKWHQHQHRQHNTAPGHPGAGHNHALSSPVRFTTFATASGAGGGNGHLKASASQGIIKMDPSAYEDDVHPGSKVF